MTSRPVGQEGHCFLVVSYEKIIQSSPGPKRLQIEKSAGITVAGNLVTDKGSASRFEPALFMRKL